MICVFNPLLRSLRKLQLLTHDTSTLFKFRGYGCATWNDARNSQYGYPLPTRKDPTFEINNSRCLI